MRLGVELAEQVELRTALDAQTQRRRTGRAAQPNRADLVHDQPELLFEGLADGHTARAADIEVRRPSPAIGDREVLVGHEDSESDHREGHADRDGDEDVGRGVDAEVHARQRDEGDETGEGPLSEVAPATVGHERVEDQHEKPRGRQHLLGRQCPSAPTGAQGNAEGPRASGDVVDDPEQDLRELHDDHRDEQVSPAPQREQRDRQGPRENLDHPPRADGREHAGHLVEPRRVGAADPAHDRVVDHRCPDRRAVQAVVKHGERCDDNRHQHDQPAQTSRPEMMR